MASAQPAVTPEMEVPASWAGVLRSMPRLRVSDWCDQHRRLEDKHTAEPGRWSTARVPYLREPHDAFADPSVSSIIVIKASRCGGTEYLNNLLAYSAHARPMPTIFVLPRTTDVNEEFRGRIRGIFTSLFDVPSIIPGGNWATDDTIHLETMTVYGAAATTPEDFIRRTSGVNLFDEVDNCAKLASRLGDIWTLLMERLTTFGYRGKQVGVTTPSTEDASGWQAYLASDRRRYWVPCPHCGTYQVLAFERIQIPDDVRDPDVVEAKELARYACEGCDAKLRDSEKFWSTARGIWVPGSQAIDERLDLASHELCERAALWGPDAWRPRLTGDAPITRHRGYWINALVSPWRSFSQVMAKFLRDKDDPHKFRVFVNSWKAEPWKEKAVSTEVQDLKKKADLGGPPDVIPDRAVVLLGAADVQANVIYYAFGAYGPNEESWLVRHGIAESFEELHRLFFLTRYPRADGKGALAGSFLAIDTGYRTNEVYDFALRHPGEVFPVKGRDAMDEKWKPALVEYYPSGRRNPFSVKLYHVNTGFFKEKVHGMAQRKSGEAGEWHLHRETTQAFFDQFTAEHHVYERPTKRRAKGRWVWKPKAEGRANHYLDVMVYMAALADIKNCRNLAPREVIEARQSQQARTPRPAGVRMPDGRPFLATQR